MLKCKLLKLHCYLSDESADEVFIKFNKKKIWPVDTKYIEMNSAEELLQVEMDAVEDGTTVEIELWDYDTWTPNDKLGVFRLVADGQGGPFTSDLIKEKGRGAKYSLEWEVH
jgi:hypothetical protein